MKQLLGGFVRTGLSALGGWLVSKGYASADDAGVLVSGGTEIVLGVSTVVATAAWSWWSKRGVTAKK